MTYPGRGPYDSGLLDAGDGPRLYADAPANAAGVPPVVLRGATGTGIPEPIATPTGLTRVGTR